MSPEPFGRDESLASSDLPLVFAVGIEDTFIGQETTTLGRLDEYELTEHYQRWEDDLQIAAASGASAIRYGIPWYRVNPEPNVWDWDWVDRVMDRILSLGLTPIVDLMHYGCPLWLEGEFDNDRYPDAVATYAAAAASRYGDRVKMWTPMNEPLLNAIFCGLEGRWPPGLTHDEGFVRLVGQLAEGIVKTQNAIREVAADSFFIHVEATFRYSGEAADAEHRRILEERNWLIYDLLLGRVDTDHPLWNYLTQSGFTDEQAAYHRSHLAPPDVMGINYYPHLTTRALTPDGTSRYDWSGTEGFDELARAFFARYQLPLFWTESSVAGSVEARMEWLQESIELVHRLRSDGIPLVGYTWWPLFSLVDWDVRESRRPPSERLVHMGLYDIVPGASGFERVETPVLAAFRDVAERFGDPASRLLK